jgi:hypothetical protein
MAYFGVTEHPQAQWCARNTEPYPARLILQGSVRPAMWEHVAIYRLIIAGLAGYGYSIDKGREKPPSTPASQSYGPCRNKSSHCRNHGHYRACMARVIVLVYNRDAKSELEDQKKSRRVDGLHGMSSTAELEGPFSHFSKDHSIPNLHHNKALLVPYYHFTRPAALRDTHP